MARARKYTGPLDEDGLTPQERIFKELYVVYGNASRAWREAHGLRQGEGHSNRGSQMLNLPHVKAAIEKTMAARVAKVQDVLTMAADTVLARYTALAKADARDLVQTTLRSCRYCWGTDHQYQFTPSEFAQHRAKWEAKVAKMTRKEGDPEPEFNPLGGIGYNPVKNAPNPDCPECFGEGAAAVRIMPSAGFTPEAAALFAGAKQTKDGIEVKMHNPLHALDRLGEHHKLFGNNQPSTDDADTRAAAIRESLDAMDDRTLAAS